jgi:hypothetical protein
MIITCSGIEIISEEFYQKEKEIMILERRERLSELATIYALKCKILMEQIDQYKKGGSQSV